MTIRELRDMLNTIDEGFLDNEISLEIDESEENWDNEEEDEEENIEIVDIHVTIRRIRE